jgi:hypothetical protein
VGRVGRRSTSARGVNGEVQVTGRSASLVSGEAARELLGRRGEGLAHDLFDRQRTAIIRLVEEQEETRGALNEGSDSPGVAVANDEIASCTAWSSTSAGRLLIIVMFEILPRRSKRPWVVA